MLFIISVLGWSILSFNYNIDRVDTSLYCFLEEFPFLRGVYMTFSYGGVLLKHLLNMSVVKFSCNGTDTICWYWHIVSLLTMSVLLKKVLVIHSQWCAGSSSTVHLISLKFMLKESEISLKLLSSSFGMNLFMIELSVRFTNFSPIWW